VEPQHIVLGLGGTVDYEIEWDSAAIEKLAWSYRIRGPDLTNLPEVVSERDFMVSLLNLLDKGMGGERYVVAPEVIHSVSSQLPYRVTLGGTPVRAALVMAVRGVPATVHLVSTNDETRALLPGGTRILSSATEDSLFPHVIVQYPGGATIELEDRVVSAPRANRVIYTHDPPNEELLLAGELGDALASARLFLVSGLNIFKDESSLRQRLDQLVSLLGKVQPERTVVYEDAGFHIPRYSQIVRDALVPSIDVYSMNEDEAQQYIGGAVDLTSGSDVVAMLKELRRLIPARHLMVHTHLWAALVGPEAIRYGEAVDAAVQMASARYHFGDSLNLDRYETIASFPHNDVAGGVGHMLSSVLGEPCAFSPGLLLETDRPTTIGLGDSFIGGFIAELAVRWE
jgi:sugar/nucleoside kinase (ribokinase family)